MSQEERIKKIPIFDYELAKIRIRLYSEVLEG